MGSQEEDLGGEVAALSTHILHRRPPLGLDLSFPCTCRLKAVEGSPDAVLAGQSTRAGAVLVLVPVLVSL